MSTKIPVGLQYPDPWLNTETTLWDMSSGSPILLTSQEQGYIGVWKVYGIDEMDQVLLQGRLPDAGPYLIDGLQNAGSISLEIRRYECGRRDDYEDQDLICHISDATVVKRQVPDLVAMASDDAGLVMAYVLLKGKVEWFWKGQNE